MKLHSCEQSLSPLNEERVRARSAGCQTCTNVSSRIFNAAHETFSTNGTSIQSSVNVGAGEYCTDGMSDITVTSRETYSDENGSKRKHMERPACDQVGFFPTNSFVISNINSDVNHTPRKALVVDIAPLTPFDTDNITERGLNLSQGQARVLCDGLEISGTDISAQTYDAVHQSGDTAGFTLPSKRNPTGNSICAENLAPDLSVTGRRRNISRSHFGTSTAFKVSRKRLRGTFNVTLRTALYSASPKRGFRTN